MAYFIDLFSPETYDAFSASDRLVAGFRPRQLTSVKRVLPGDFLICYVTKLSRWAGVLEVNSSHFVDDSNIFTLDSDPFVLRFKVQPIVWLPLVNAIPVYEPISWNNLSFSTSHPLRTRALTSMVRGSLRQLKRSDGEHLETILKQQKVEAKVYPFNTEG